MVRQDTALWRMLHQGCLTGGLINAALGLYEPAAARKLGMPSSFVGHQRLLAAYSNLLLPVHRVESASPDPPSKCAAASADGGDASRPQPSAASGRRRKKPGHGSQVLLAPRSSALSAQPVVCSTKP